MQKAKCKMRNECVRVADGLLCRGNAPPLQKLSFLHHNYPLTNVNRFPLHLELVEKIVQGDQVGEEFAHPVF